MAAVLAVLLVRLPDDSRFLQELENAGHAALFGAASLLLLRRTGDVTRQHLLAGLATLLLGFVTELVQWSAGLDFEALDVVRDGAGAFAALAVSWTIHRPVRSDLRFGLRSAAALSMLLVFLPPLLTSAAIARRWATFPVLADFESPLEKRFLTDSGDVRLVGSPASVREADAGRAVRVTFRPALYSGWSISGPFPNWSRYRRLAFSVYSELTTHVSMNVRIHDAQHDQSYSDRFNCIVDIAPGPNRIVIPLDAVERAPRGRRLELSRVKAIGMFFVRPPGPFDLVFDDFTLEGAGRSSPTAAPEGR